MKLKEAEEESKKLFELGYIGMITGDDKNGDVAILIVGKK